MFLSMNWIKDFVDLSGLDELMLINQFSLSTAEVENDIQFKGSDISGIVVAEIKSVDEHPESKKLHLLKVDIGEDELVDVVCGAPNVRVGMKTAFAKVGAKIGEIEIAPRPLAGFMSCGMCCSEKEIGISDDHSGIMEITDDVALGTDLKDIYAIDDIIFEVDNKSLTNRPDLWSHYGIAREFAAIAQRPLKELVLYDLSLFDELPKVDMDIQDPLCYRYSCLQFENCTRSVSPVDMRIRLFYCGMRAINFLADMTNYLMLEMGQPMHAFDSRKVENIRIKRFDHDFTFQTLDGVERNIDPETLMICNGDIPVAIAGIMGGLDSEIVEDTRTLTLESATFDAASIRKSTVRLSHRTDSSMRYEKSLDPELTTAAIARFVFLIKKFDSGVKIVSSLTDEYAYHYPTVRLSFDKAYVDKYTGIEIDNDTIVSTLQRLGFEVSCKNDEFEVLVPSWRATKDVTIKADIIEEITRIYGYDNFEIHTANAPLFPTRPEPVKKDEDNVKDILVKHFNLHELHSYVWNYADELKELGIANEGVIKLANASNPNIETIRRTMIPTQLCQIRSNLGYAPAYGIFEVGRVVTGMTEDNLCIEEKHLGITLYQKGNQVREQYFKMKAIIETLVDELKHKTVTFEKLEPEFDFEHPVNLNAVIVDGNAIGKIGMIHPSVMKKLDKRATVVFAEIDMDKFAAIENYSIRYEEPSKFPAIEIDLSFVTAVFAPIMEAIKKAACELIKKIDVVDIYEDGDNSSIAVRLTFSDNTRTLTREEVTAVTDGIIADLEEKGIKLKK
ncbi:MAG: phenylalanine--tRNA ligase subunit beta [Ruminococcus sp.]|uniref:phenylalanine--tRNA ligase subunit beta n=1 Tax=Ruminococcus sp. TaxID=41978 RepID=UPI0028734BD9|nr:phenylalanine--tRNA ligase subunit beta [Ruminococcus sp.]MBQ3285825.1 phenylalanine--tRNA ligase subunit beta [Ruminococcus sp.]